MNTNTSGREKTAVKTFKEGNNCTQSILVAFQDQIGIEKEQCLRLGNPFGAGMAFRQETCGVITGSLMVLGMICGSESQEKAEKREACYDIAQVFLQNFSERHGSILCRDLLDCDITTPEKRSRAMEEGIFTERCVPAAQRRKYY